jgi:cytochrome c-type biogenesis protein CcmE
MNTATSGAGGAVSRAAALKIVGSVLVVVAAAGSVLYLSATPGMEHYRHVDEVMAKVDAFRGKKLQVHGFVVKDSILKKTGSLDYRFKLETRAPRTVAVIDAAYSGLVPDNFKSGAEVVARGSLTADNRLIVVPDGISAKCPSKYDADAPKLKASDLPTASR